MNNLDENIIYLRRLSVIGLGYIGLPTAAMFASHGFSVTGIEINQDVIDSINRGHAHVIETDLDELVKQVVATGHLRADRHVTTSEIFIIAVPTPFKANYAPDLSYVQAAVESIAAVLCAGNLVILESTSPVGTTEEIAKWIAHHRPDLNVTEDIRIAYCPERVLPGKILHELIHNDRIIGGLTEQAGKAASELYQTFVKGKCFLTHAKTAEMAKLTENSYRDVNIAFANELSMICDRLDIDVWELIRLANQHPRVNILQPGPGVGGHCIAVDPWFIVDATPRDVRLIRAAREVNDAKPSFVVDQVKQAAADLTQPVIACLGLSYKANIDDIRESPAVEVVHRLIRNTSWRILVVEPFIQKLPETLGKTKRVELHSLTDALQFADIIVVLVDHDVFKTIPANVIAAKRIIDTRGMFKKILQESEDILVENLVCV